MSFLLHIITYILANSIAIWIANRFISGFEFSGNWQELIVAGAVLGIINSLLRPILKLITFPLVFLTLGLFTVIINIAMLYLADEVLSTLTIHGIWSAIWGVIIISVVNNIILNTTKKRD